MMDLVSGDDKTMDQQPSLFHLSSDDNDDVDYTQNHFSN